VAEAARSPEVDRGPPGSVLPLLFDLDRQPIIDP